MNKNNRGFSLLELLVVIGIIGILVSIGSVSFTAAQARGRDAKRRGDLQAVSKALEQYYAENDSEYPVDASCTGYDSYLASGAPSDPRYGYLYTDNTANTRSGGTGEFCAATGLAYCVCIELEATGTGNAYGRSGSTCTWTGTGDKNYYCVSNLQ